MSWAVEDVVDRVGGGVTLGARGRVCNADPIMVCSEPRTVARPQLRQCGLVVSGENPLGRVNVRGRGSKDPVRGDVTQVS